tara:strand:- start:25309 stop:25623 length:315 start_codon:yes stop_codon:yes gene_type:complete
VPAPAPTPPEHLAGRARKTREPGARNPLAPKRKVVDRDGMSDEDDLPQPKDHLPPRDEREHDVPQETYPDGGAPEGEAGVSPETAAEPDKPNRHGVDQIPPRGR